MLDATPAFCSPAGAGRRDVNHGAGRLNVRGEVTGGIWVMSAGAGTGGDGGRAGSLSNAATTTPRASAGDWCGGVEEWGAAEVGVGVEGLTGGL